MDLERGIGRDTKWKNRAGKGQVTRFNTRMKADIAIVTIRTATGLM
jgi:hypothetical protein